MKRTSSETTDPKTTPPLDQNPDPNQDRDQAPDLQDPHSDRVLQSPGSPDRDRGQDPDADPERDCDSDPELLLGSGSRRSLSELLAGERRPEPGDQLFLDRNFPVGELELQSGVRWRRPRVGEAHIWNI